MKRVYIIAAIATGLLVLTLDSMAQTDETKKNREKDVILSIGINGGAGTGKFNDTHKWGLGGSFQADIPVSGKWYATINAGYLNFFGKEIAKNNNHYSVTDAQFLPVKAGIKYFPLGMFYVQGEAGISIALNKSNLDYSRTVAFVYAGLVGARLPLGENNNLDIGAFYERTSKFKEGAKDSKVNYYGLRIAYPFTL